MPFGITLPCAVIIFPLVYIMSDLLTEVYGIKLSVMIISMNTLINLFMSFIFAIAICIPPAPFYQYNNDFAIILGNTPRIVFASLLAYYSGDIINSISLSYFKYKHLNKGFFFRSIVSSLLGQIFDTCVFIMIGFFGIISFNQLLQMIVFQYIVKISYEIICYPITRIVVDRWKKLENIDVIDRWKNM